MDKRIIGDKIVCTKCGTVNIIYEDGIKYPAEYKKYCIVPSVMKSSATRTPPFHSTPASNNLAPTTKIRIMDASTIGVWYGIIRGSKRPNG